MSGLLQWLAHIAGLDEQGSGRWYLWWSGMGSDLGELAIVTAGLSIYFRHNCHVKGCLRIGRRQVEGTSFVVCRKHHPEPEPTHEELIRRHKQRRSPSPGPSRRRLTPEDRAAHVEAIRRDLDVPL